MVAGPDFLLRGGGWGRLKGGPLDPPLAYRSAGRSE